MQRRTEKLFRFSLVLFIVLSVLFMLVYARNFFIPVAYAMVFAMLLLPVSKKLEALNWQRGWAITVCILLLLVIFSGIGFLLSSQIISFSKDISQLQEALMQKVDDLQQFVAAKFGVSAAKQLEYLKSKAGSFLSKAAGQVQNVVLATTGFIGNSLLVLVYIIFFLLYREKFVQFILKLTPNEEHDESKDIIHQSSKVAQQYLFGKIMLIIILALLYGVGLTILGLKHAWLFAFLAALLSLIPYIGNIIGGFFPVAMALLTQGFGTALGAVVVFSIAQLLESYILTPMIVGSEVDLNPLFTIIIVIIGGVLWGISGMILAVPFLGILKIIFDHIDPLKPYGYLVGDEGGESKSTKYIKEKFRS